MIKSVMQKLTVATTIGFLLSACASTPTVEPIIRTVTVNVPVPVRCDPQISPAPAYPDTDAALAAQSDIFTATQTLLAGRAMRIAREGELDAALQACRGVQVPAPH